MAQPAKPTAKKPPERKPYERPSLRDEHVFEREALQASCNEGFNPACDPADIGQKTAS